MNRRGSQSSDDSYQNGPELRSIRIGSVASTNQPTIAFSSGFVAKEEPIAKQPLHTEEWNLPEELPAIPSGYALGYSHAIIHDASPQTVANRIVEGLAMYSIAPTPHESHPVRLSRVHCCGVWPTFHS